MQAFLMLIAAVVVGGLAPQPAPGGTRQGPADPPASYYFLLGRHLEDDGKIEEAIAAHRKAITLDPESAEIRAELASLYARQDRSREALETAEEAVQRDPDNRQANEILGTLYAVMSEQRKPLRAGDNPAEYGARAIAALEKSRREAGFDVNVELMLGRLYLTARDYERAIVSLRRVVEDQPGYPEAAMLLAAAQAGAGQTDDEIRTLESAVAHNPKFFRAWLRVAELYEQQRRFAEAAAAYAKAGGASSRIDVSTRQAAALINAGKAAEARVLLQAAMQKTAAPDAGLIYMLGQAQRMLKDLDAAAAAVERLRTAFPADPRGPYLDAQVLRDRGRTADAIAAFERLLQRTPEDPALVYEYASLLERGGRVGDAERTLRELLAKDPTDANALNSLGYLLAEHGQRLDEAVDLVQRALEIEPANPSFLDSLGWAYFRQGRLDLADAPLTRAAAGLPRSSTVHEHLGDLRFRQERFADAAAAFERSLAGDGDAIDRPKVEQKARDARARLKR